MKIINSDTTEIQMKKRCHIPVTLKDRCPNCKNEITVNLSKGAYLSYPSPNEPFNYSFSCSECGHEWESEIIVLKVTLEHRNI